MLNIEHGSSLLFLLCGEALGTELFIVQEMLPFIAAVCAVCCLSRGSSSPLERMCGSILEDGWSMGWILLVHVEVEEEIISLRRGFGEDREESTTCELECNRHFDSSCRKKSLTCWDYLCIMKGKYHVMNQWEPNWKLSQMLLIRVLMWATTGLYSLELMRIGDCNRKERTLVPNRKENTYLLRK